MEYRLLAKPRLYVAQLTTAWEEVPVVRGRDDQQGFIYWAVSASQPGSFFSASHSCRACLRKFSNGASAKRKQSLDAIEKAVQSALKGVPDTPRIEVFAEPGAVGIAVPLGVSPMGCTFPNGEGVQNFV